MGRKSFHFSGKNESENAWPPLDASENGIFYSSDDLGDKVWGLGAGLGLL